MRALAKAKAGAATATIISLALWLACATGFWAAVVWRVLPVWNAGMCLAAALAVWLAIALLAWRYIGFAMENGLVALGR